MIAFIHKQIQEIEGCADKLEELLAHGCDAFEYMTKRIDKENVTDCDENIGLPSNAYPLVASIQSKELIPTSEGEDNAASVC